MHSLGIVHRDLKLENLLLDQNQDLVITDFGFAIKTDSDALLLTSCGSPCYAGPELVVSEGYRGPPADIWSCGIILYAMTAGYLPYDDDPMNPDGENIQLLYRYILESELGYPAHVCPDAVALMKRILVGDPVVRIDIEGILDSAFMEGVGSHVREEMSGYTKDVNGDENVLNEEVVESEVIISAVGSMVGLEVASNTLVKESTTTHETVETSLINVTSGVEVPTNRTVTQAIEVIESSTSEIAHQTLTITHIESQTSKIIIDTDLNNADTVKENSELVQEFNDIKIREVKSTDGINVIDTNEISIISVDKDLPQLPVHVIEQHQVRQEMYEEKNEPKKRYDSFKYY